EEVLVAPLFETGIIHQRGVGGADAPPGPVEVDDVLAEGVVGREVGAAAEPLLVALGQEAEVGVDGGHEGVARVQHQRDAGRGDGAAPGTRQCLAGHFFFRSLSRALTMSSISRGVKLPLIWPWVPMAAWITGAMTTRPSTTTASRWPLLAAVRANRRSPPSFV